MIKIRRNKDKISCDSCTKRIDEGAELFDIYIGTKEQGFIITLCNDCMHELLTKLIKMGKR